MNKQIIINKYVTFPACILLSVLTACNDVKDSTQDYTNKETDKAVQTITESSQQYEEELNKTFKKFNSEVNNKSENAFDKAKESMRDANQSLAQMTVEQKEDALEAVELSLDEIDEQIDAFEDWYDDKESTMSESTKKKYKTSLSTLKKQKGLVEVWEEKLEASTPDTWDKVKEGFSSAYSSMAQSWNNLFESDAKPIDTKQVAINEQKYIYYTINHFDPSDDSLTKNIAHYSVKEKELAMKDINSSLNALDEQIEDYADWCSDHKDKVTADTYKRHQTTLVSMKTYRKLLQNSYEKLDDSTPDTWDKVKNGFSESYNDMTTALSKMFRSDDYVVKTANPNKRIYANNKSHVIKSASIAQKDTALKRIDSSIEEIDALISDYRTWYNNNTGALEKREYYYTILTNLEKKRESLAQMRKEIANSDENNWDDAKEKLLASYDSMIQSWNSFIEKENKTKAEYAKAKQEIKELSADVSNSSGAAFNKAKLKLNSAAKDIQEYTLEKKNEALKEVKASLKEIDNQIVRFERWCEANKSSLPAKDRMNYKSTLIKLKQERDEVIDWISELESSPDNKWDETKSKLSKAYSKMINTWNLFTEELTNES